MRAGASVALLATAAAAALVTFAFAATPAGAAFTGQNGKIVFDTQRGTDFNLEIYSMNSDGSGEANLTNDDSEDDLAPAWSANGQKIAFYTFRNGDAEVWTMSSNGSSQTQLTTQANAPNSQPAWSPDGTKIAFTSSRDGNDEIYVMNANGSGQTRLTTNAATDDEPAWSPNGTKIAFVSTRDGNREVYTMNSNGSSPLRLTTNALDDYAPNWSPNGLQIAFTSMRDGNPEIYRMSQGGGAQTRLTNNSAVDQQPAFSPDGTRIAFETQRDGCCAPEIYTMLASGSGATNVTQNEGDDATPDWQPVTNGQVVAVLDAVPDDPQDFSFTAGGGLSPSTFQLDDDSNGTLPNTETFTNIQPQSGYSLSNTVPPGWDQSSATCSDGSPVSNIDVDSSETVTCTFTNRRTGKIVVVQDSLPDDPQDFSYTAGGGLTPSTFQLDDDLDPQLSDTQTFDSLDPGSGYSISQAALGGWDLSSATCSDGSPISNIDLAAGETVTCTFTNRKRGQIVVVKDAQPDDPQNFTFSAGGGLSPSAFQLDDDTDPTLANTRTFNDIQAASGYSVSESMPSGWTQAGAVCDDGSPATNIDVAPGETVTCTFTNRKNGTIVVVKDAQPNDAQNFSFSAGGGLSPSSFQLDDDSDGTLSNTRTFLNISPAGGYSVSETPVSGWKQSGLGCSDGSTISNIEVDPGETVTCTFVNSKIFYDTPIAAATLSASIVPEFRQTISATQCQARGGTASNHGPPLGFTSCNPPTFAPGTRAHFGTAGIGQATLSALPGDLVTAPDEADLSLSATLSDVRNVSATGADYDPNPSGDDITLLFRTRIHDVFNGPSQSSPGTVSDLTLTAPGNCLPSAEPATGSTCVVSTTANALTPGTIREGKQMLLQVFRLRVNDSGANGVRGDSDDRAFAMQGMYVP